MFTWAQMMPLLTRLNVYVVVNHVDSWTWGPSDHFCGLGMKSSVNMDFCGQFVGEMFCESTTSLRLGKTYENLSTILLI
jgi:hypothetical protein